MTQQALIFDGATFEASLDAPRLTTQFERVRSLMSDQKWRTLAEIQAVTGGSEAAVSARLRDLRKIRFGRCTVERRRRGEPANGVHEYRVIGEAE